MPHLRQSVLVRKSANVGTAAPRCPVERSSTVGWESLAPRPRVHSWARVASAGLILTTISLLVGCRLDMQVQPKQSPFVRSDFFPDQRSERPLVEGTVARGQLHENAYLYTGKIGTTFGDYMPFPLTKEALERGQQRYNIYCSPCHSMLGDGKGFVPSRGFSRMPPSYHTPELEKAPLGQLFDVITHGFGIMPDYRSQIAPEDRWKIVAYVRALQLSQNATKADVPPGQPIPSEPPKFVTPVGTGATLPEIESGSTSSSEEHQ
ncbi:MAG: cytochrome c [Candidatus Sulfotelmatobacter sp.]